MKWSWYIPRDGHFGDNIVFDVIRIVSVVIMGFEIMWLLRIRRESQRREQDIYAPARRTITVSACVAMLGLMYVQVKSLGLVASYLTILAAIMPTLVGIAIYQYRSQQRRQPVVTE